jgi:hypothetical protein
VPYVLGLLKDAVQGACLAQEEALRRGSRGALASAHRAQATELRLLRDEILRLLSALLGTTERRNDGDGASRDPKTRDPKTTLVATRALVDARAVDDALFCVLAYAVQEDLRRDVPSRSWSWSPSLTSRSALLSTIQRHARCDAADADAADADAADADAGALRATSALLAREAEARSRAAGWDRGEPHASPRTCRHALQLIAAVQSASPRVWEPVVLGKPDGAGLAPLLGLLLHRNRSLVVGAVRILREAVRAYPQLRRRMHFLGVFPMLLAALRLPRGISVDACSMLDEHHLEQDEAGDGADGYGADGYGLDGHGEDGHGEDGRRVAEGCLDRSRVYDIDAEEGDYGRSYLRHYLPAPIVLRLCQKGPKAFAALLNGPNAPGDVAPDARASRGEAEDRGATGVPAVRDGCERDDRTLWTTAMKNRLVEAIADELSGVRAQMMVQRHPPTFALGRGGLLRRAARLDYSDLVDGGPARSDERSAASARPAAPLPS